MLKRIPWAKPHFYGNEAKYVTNAIESTWISGGAYLDELELKFRDICDKKHALAVSNGTTAIHLAYLALGIKPGDEIIVPGFCFLAAANIAIHVGATPVFSEVDKNTWCMDPVDLERRITNRTKAIVPVHTYGNVCDMDLIMDIARKRKIAVIEDCAESLFSKFKDRQSGSFGVINTFSFQATKTITTGEGGMVVTDDDEFAERMLLYRSHGMNRKKVIYWHELPGHNFRLTNMQAALGIAQLENALDIIKTRKQVYDKYVSHFSNVSCVSIQKINSNVDPLIWAFALRLNEEAFPQGRDMVRKQMDELGIETRPGFYASSLLNIYTNHKLPVSESISENVISLPSFPTLSDEEIEYISNGLLKLRK